MHAQNDNHILELHGYTLCDLQKLYNLYCIVNAMHNIASYYIDDIMLRNDTV